MKRLLPLLCLLVPLAAMAEVRKWVDSEGKVHYGDRPPAATEPGKAKKLRIPTSTLPAAGGGETKSWADRELDYRQRKQEEADAAKKTAQEQEQAKAKEENCRLARQNLKALQEGQRMAKYNDKGERVMMDDAERDEATAVAQKQVNDWCR